MQTSFFGEVLDVSTVNPRSEFEPVPGGWHAARIIDWETKPDKSRFLAAKVVLQVTQGPCAGRQIFENNFVMVHKESQQAHDIGQRKLRSLCDAVGVDPSRLASADPFLNHEIMVKVSVQPGREYNGKNYGPSNRIDAFAPYDGMPVDTAAHYAPAPVQRTVAPPQSAPVQRPVAQPPMAARPTAPAPARAQGIAGGDPQTPRMPWNRGNGTH